MISAILCLVLLGLLPSGFGRIPTNQPNHQLMRCATTQLLNGTTGILEGRQEHSPPNSGSRIKVYWNVIMPENDDSESGGNLTDSTIRWQMKVLNRDFKDVRISFELERIRRVQNSTWFSVENGTLAEYEMKRALAEHKPDALDIYSLRPPSGMSWAVIPSFARQALEHDGVVLNFQEVANNGTFLTRVFGLVAPIPGNTLTHEVGHWAGLQHTYEGGCEGDNDGLEDTPPHIQSSDFFIRYWVFPWCPFSSSTCPGGRPDPLDNFMSRSPGQCLKRFTADQIARMHRVLESLRGITPAPTNYDSPNHA